MTRYFLKLGDLLRAARTKAGLSQNDVAKKLKFEQQFVSSWERGISAPPFRRMNKLAELYHISLDQIQNALLDDAIERTRLQIEDEFLKLSKKRRSG
ncbi:MAG: helix-turn-helix transcriptional regulator [Oligoflexia bacterium]|nr:helix-turn-helix transcriptional regulator [Oligoflexia bacterium]